MSSEPGGLPPRVLGIDYGRKRVGVAVTDPLGIMAQPLPVIHNVDEIATCAQIKKICDEKDVKRIVVGLPKNMDGSLGPMAREVEEFARLLARETRITVETFDERLTSFDAESRLAEAGLHWKQRKKRIDQVAAVLILQSWLERRGKALGSGSSDEEAEAPRRPRPRRPEN